MQWRQRIGPGGRVFKTTLNPASIQGSERAEEQRGLALGEEGEMGQVPVPAAGPMLCKGPARSPARGWRGATPHPTPAWAGLAVGTVICKGLSSCHLEVGKIHGLRVSGRRQDLLSSPPGYEGRKI